MSLVGKCGSQHLGRGARGRSAVRHSQHGPLRLPHPRAGPWTPAELSQAGAVTAGRPCHGIGLGFSQIAFLSSSRGPGCKVSSIYPTQGTLAGGGRDAAGLEQRGGDSWEAPMATTQV